MHYSHGEYKYTQVTIISKIILLLFDIVEKSISLGSLILWHCINKYSFHTDSLLVGSSYRYTHAKCVCVQLKMAHNATQFFFLHANRVAKVYWIQRSFEHFLHALSITEISRTHVRNLGILTDIFSDTCIREGVLPKYCV